MHTVWGFFLSQIDRLFYPVIFLGTWFLIYTTSAMLISALYSSFKIQGKAFQMFAMIQN